MTDSRDARLGNRYPEFARMSLRPGIGHAALHEVAHTLMSLDLDETQADVPSSLRHGKKLLPLGRYLRRNLREMVGKDAKAPRNEKLQAEMRKLLENSIRDGRSLKAQSVAETEGKAASLVGRSKLYKDRRSI